MLSIAESFEKARENSGECLIGVVITALHKVPQLFG
jgi:hypothetical protein